MRNYQDDRVEPSTTTNRTSLGVLLVLLLVLADVVAANGCAAVGGSECRGAAAAFSDSKQKNPQPRPHEVRKLLSP